MYGAVTSAMMKVQGRSSEMMMFRYGCVESKEYGMKDLEGQLTTQSRYVTNSTTRDNGANHIFICRRGGGIWMR